MVDRERQASRARARGARIPPAAEPDVWRAFTQDIAPLKGRDRTPVRSAPAIPPPGKTTVATRAAQPTLRPKTSLPELKPGLSPGVDRRTAERLRRGEIPLDIEIDLHGHTLEEAHRALRGFIERASAAGCRCVLVITGHGGRSAAGRGALREALPRWLNEPALRPRILALASAQPKHGGPGAFYVLLKRRRSLGEP